MNSETTSMDWDHVGEPTGAAATDASASSNAPPEGARSEMRKAFTDPAQYAELAAKTMDLKSVMKLPGFWVERVEIPRRCCVDAFGSQRCSSMVSYGARVGSRGKFTLN